MTREMCAFFENRVCDEDCVAYKPFGCRRFIDEDVEAVADLCRCWLSSGGRLGCGVIPVHVDGEIEVNNYECE